MAADRQPQGYFLTTSGPYSERVFPVGQAGGLVGRSRKCCISLLHDCEVSHNHAVMDVHDGSLYIRDVGSTFGTYLNDKRLSEPKRASDAHKLKPCDSIKVGQTSLRWRPIDDIQGPGKGQSKVGYILQYQGWEKLIEFMSFINEFTNSLTLSLSFLSLK